MIFLSKLRSKVPYLLELHKAHTRINIKAHEWRQMLGHSILILKLELIPVNTVLNHETQYFFEIVFIIP